MFRKIIFIVSVCLLISHSTQAKGLQVAYSPDGGIRLEIKQTEGYTSAVVWHQDKVVVPEIRFGLETANHLFYKNMCCLGFSKQKKLSEQYTAIHGKSSVRSNRANTFTMYLENTNKEKLDIEFKVFDDGIGFRYCLRDKTIDTELRFQKEFTAYRIPFASERWMQHYVPHYEGDFPYAKDSISQSQWGYPALTSTNGQWALFTEANIDRNYCATHLENMNDPELYQVAYPRHEEGNGRGDVFPSSSSPWHSPWRLIIIGSLKDIVQSTLVEDISTPSKITRTDWIQPGSAAWVYWAYNHGTKDYKICCNYVDLAANMRWKYVLFDWEWDQMENGGNLQDAAAYALSKGVKPLIWYNSGGDHNRVSSTPKDRLITAENRHNEFQRLKEMGFVGIKVDFFESDKQHMMNYYIDILEDAAKYELMVNFHGCTLPRGWSRTYPHLISMEAVYGAEQYNNSSYMTAAGARLNCTFPFTRNVVGAMDYTPVTFTHSQYPHHTSNVHELALSVIFESAIQHWADRPEGFYHLPQEARSFMSNVPTNWDETHFIEGFPGKRVIIARRKGTEWYLAGINGTEYAEKLNISLSFLGKANYQLTEFTDGELTDKMIIQQKAVNRNDNIVIRWMPQGGFVAWLKVIYVHH